MDISIVIVSFNTREILLFCLESIFKFTKDVRFEVIIVDNNSTDGSVEALKKFGKKIKLLKNKENLGFARANNQGIKTAKGEYILLLNSDTLIFSDSISKMINWMEENKECGVASCTLLNKEKTIQASGGYFPTLGRVFLWSTFLDDIPYVADLFGSYHPHTNYLFGNFYKKEQQVDWVTGAFFLLRRNVVQKVGSLDEDFFMYVEELEYCYRIKKAGWKVIYTPITQIIHLGGASGVKENIVRGEFKGLRLFYSKHESFSERIILEVFLKIAAMARIVLFGLLGRGKMAKVYVKAVLA